MSIRNLTIKRAIAHEALHKTKVSVELGERPPFESSQLISLDDDVQHLISYRLTNALGLGGSSVIVSVDEDYKEPFLTISSMLDVSDELFITSSQSLARQLSNAQVAGSIKSGIALFIQGSCLSDGQEARFISIIKADSDSALSKRTGDNAISFDFIPDLLFSSSQRLIKIAFFVEETKKEGTEPRLPDDFSIKIYDHIMRDSNNKSAAIYFYSSFLKCKIAETAAIQTKKFYETTIGFINDSDFPQEEKVRLRGDVISRFRDNVAVVNPTIFANEIFPGKYLDSFLNTCNKNGIIDSFSKDTALINSKLRKQSIRFSSNVTIYAPPEVMKNDVEIKNPDKDGWTEIKIRGYVTP